MKTPYLDKEIKLLESFKDKKEASFYQLRKLAEYLEIKQLLIHSVVVTLCECAMPDPIDPFAEVDKDTCRKCNNLIA